MTKNDCVPVYIALQLMDYSSLGRGNDYEDFKQTSRALQKALKAIVNGLLLSGNLENQDTDYYRASPGLQ